MKTALSSVLTSAAMVLSLHGAATTPVGYTTYTIYNGVANLIGITLHGSIQSTGSVTGVNGAVVTTADGVVDALGTGPFLFEVTSGTITGSAALITSFDAGANTLTLDTNLAAAGLAATHTFVIRQAPTIGSVFGTGDNVGINKGGATTGDLIYVPTGGGAFDIYYHSADSIFGAGAWTKVGGGGQGANTPLLYTDALYVLNRSGANYDIVLTGEVKTTPSILGMLDTFNYVSAVYPVGVTLNGSGIADSPGFQKGGSTSGDLVYLTSTTSPGSYRIFYRTADSIFGAGTWQEIGQSGDKGNVELTSAIIIQRRAASQYNAGISVPAGWAIDN